MAQNQILLQNEQETNRLSAKIMILSIGFLGFVYLLNVIGLFKTDLNRMLLIVIACSLLLLIPILMVLVLGWRASWMKYFIITTCAVVVGLANLYLSKDMVILYIYPVTIASLYFSRALSWYSLILSLVTLTASQIVSTNLHLTDDKNYATDWLIPVLSRGIELMLMALVYIVLAKRTKAMLDNVVGAEEQQAVLGRLSAVIGKSSEVSDILVESVSQLSEITEQATQVNSQIASDTELLAASSEDTLLRIRTASSSVSDISRDLERIASENASITAISMQVDEMTESSGVAIQSAIEEMRAIEQTTLKSKDLVNRLGQRSAEIHKIVEVITGIAEETNLLALNAAIEAARAGDEGRGFSVVAQEVRKLAEQSGRAAKDIGQLVSEVLGETTQANAAMDATAELIGNGLAVIDQAGRSFEQVAGASREVNRKIREVGAISRDIARSGTQLVDIVEEIQETNQRSLTGIEAIASASEQQLASMQQVGSSVDAIGQISNELLTVISQK